MKIAAVIYGAGEAYAVDDILSALADRLRGEGRRLAGAVQHNTLDAAAPCSDMLIEDLASGKQTHISMSLTEAAGGCRLNATLLEDAVGIVAAGLHGSVELVVINRFGKQESAGRGFRSVIEEAVAREIPLLVALNTIHRTDWEAFTRGAGTVLPPTAAAVEAWCRSVLPPAAGTSVHTAM